MRYLLGLLAILAACGGRMEPKSLDDIRAPDWRLAELELHKISSAMYRWDMAGRAGCPSVRELRIIAPNLSDRDPWGHRYVTRCDVRGFVAVSVGPDGDLGTRDDATSPLVIPHRATSDVGVANNGLIDINSRVLLRAQQRP